VFGWITFMWRKTGSADGPWDLPWTSYVNGFGFNSTYLWLGLERIHQLTTTGNWRLRIEYTRSPNYDWVSAEYWTFSVGSNASSYTIHFSG
jgi:Fibrinogen beta and gamma chains, C-terminal globular domain